MKKYLIMLSLLAIIIPQQSRALPSCSNTVNLEGNITQNRLLSADSLYVLRGCVTVTNNATLTIEAGTTIVGAKNSDGGLVIDRGAFLVSQATASAPIIFTSDQEVGSREPGDWRGVSILGQATNNQSNSLTLSDHSCALTGGGTNNADSSGVFRYMVVAYAQNGFTFNSVGNKTVVDFIQVLHAAQNGFEFLGGTVNARHMIALDNKGDDMVFGYGNQSKIQYALLMRMDSSAYLTSGSNGVRLFNNQTSPYTASLTTAPTLSNFTIIGAKYRGFTTINSHIQNGVLFEKGTAGYLNNSFIDGYNIGVYFTEAATLNNADVNGTLQLQYCAFKDNVTDYGISGTWPGSCSANLMDWITNADNYSCEQIGNNFAILTTGYNSDIVSNYPYVSSEPTLTVSGTSDLASTQYVSLGLSLLFFDSAVNKGALQATNWAAIWPRWNAQNSSNCADIFLAQRSGHQIASSTMSLFPNPNKGTFSVVYSPTATGKARIVIGNTAGQVIKKEAYQQVNAISVNQQFMLTTSGIYWVTIIEPNGNMMVDKIVVE